MRVSPHASHVAAADCPRAANKGDSGFKRRMMPPKRTDTTHSSTTTYVQPSTQGISALTMVDAAGTLGIQQAFEETFTTETDAQARVVRRGNWGELLVIGYLGRFENRKSRHDFLKSHLIAAAGRARCTCQSHGLRFFAQLLLSVLHTDHYDAACESCAREVEMSSHNASCCRQGKHAQQGH